MLWLGRPFREFAPYGRDNVTKSLFDPSLVKTNLIDPMNVRELFCPFLQQNDRAGEAEASLKETCLVNDVLPRPHTAIRRLVLSGHHKDGKGALREHVIQYVADGMTCTGPDLVRFDAVRMLLVQMILEVSPLGTATVPNEDGGRIRRLPLRHREPRTGSMSLEYFEDGLNTATVSSSHLNYARRP